MTVEKSEPVRTWLAQRMGVEAEDIVVVAPEVGYSSETWLIGVRNNDPSLRMVVRVAGADNGIFPASRLADEYFALQMLAPTLVRVPAPLFWSGAAENPFGRDLFAMEFVEGWVPTDHPSYARQGRLFDLPPSQQRSLQCDLIGQLAQLGQVEPSVDDWPRFGIHDCSDPADLALANLRAFDPVRTLALGPGPHPVVDAARALLERTAPTECRPAVSWGDVKVSNILFGEDATVQVLLDWEMLSVADGAADLGFYLVFHEVNTTRRGIPDLPGFLSQDDLVALYEERSGTPVSNLPYFRLWAAYRLAILEARLVHILEESGRLRRTGKSKPGMRALEDEIARYQTSL